MQQKGMKIGACLLGGALLFVGVGCGGGQGGSTPVYPVEQDDELRTQLYVYNSAYTQDMEWLNALKTEFETLHAQDTCWEDGKQGVQVVIHNVASDFENDASRVLANREEVYFAFDADVRALQKGGALADLTSLVTESETETWSVKSKLTESQQAYYSIEEDGQETYYALPDRFGSVGFVYNQTLFDEKGYYFSEDGTEEKPFVADMGGLRTLGADETRGTWDDGLPTTQDEFFALCRRIAQDGNVPVLWSASEHDKYLTWLAASLAAAENGYEQTMLNYTLQGTAKNLGSIKNGGFAADAQSTEITPENGYELARSAGNYYALAFLEELTDSKNGYCGAVNYSEEFTKSQTALRKAFREGLDGGKQIGMIVDGTWFESGGETLAVERTTAMQEKRFAWMPSPLVTKHDWTDGAVVDCLNSSAFIKANVEGWKMPLAQEFLRFAYTDDALRGYTELTGVQKAVNYGLDDSLSEFENSVRQARRNTKHVYAYSMAETLLANERFFSPNELWRAKFGGLAGFATPVQYPSVALIKDNTSVVDYFNGMYMYRKDNWPAK